MLAKHKPSALCNQYWRPLNIHDTKQEVTEERSSQNFNNMDHSEGNIVFEKRFERETFCWSCKKEIDTDSNEKCVECNWGIKCECGKCACDDPRSKVKKKGIYA